ncbi:GNAT family N-acetyltransferase [Robiginitalea sp. M366]|uniref:GNAT family N-acetyltransferase n=1 Tax=Robiginitalea aestuariiviva TaxID=3036903 RepID=UPI00240E3C91|nr:GNAT family N-acetyltransferase [Robiginitalea aestuariiviva]MDG1572719.1 GNAT family N-acetyltransferase [Robiginitalea aestuariiviva]
MGNKPTPNQQYHLAFIGSGISSSFTLLQLLQKLEGQPTGLPMGILVLDQYPEFITGIPYGERSGAAVLLITSLRDFLPEPERSRFTAWLSENKAPLLEQFRKEGGTRSRNWLEKHQEEIDANQWEDIFLPRMFFGQYLKAQLESQLERAKTQGTATVRFVQGEVNRLSRQGDTWALATTEGIGYTADQVVLGIGSMPNRLLWGQHRWEEKSGLLFLNDLYYKGLGAALEQVAAFAKTKGSPLNIAVIGANASALEVIYRLNDMEGLRDCYGHFYILSTYGLLPDARPDQEKLKSYKTVNLERLKAKAKISAREIYQAANQDLDRAAAIDLGARSTVGVVSQAVGELLGRLDELELAEFACRYGNEIGRRQRCAGEHYVETLEALQAENRLEHIAGRFQDMVRDPETGQWHLHYTDTPSGNDKMLDRPVTLVINCAGAMDLYSREAPELVHNLMDQELAVPNASRIGFEVNDRLETSPNLHVVGPLLGGNVIQGNAVWHVEHCGRIIWLSGMLAQVLAEPWAHRDTLESLSLEVLEIGTEEEARETYTQLLDAHWDANPYACLPYMFHHHQDQNRLVAFQFLDRGGQTQVMMPMIIRPILEAAEGGPWFDAISPYGYSGPLIREGAPDYLVAAFWQRVDHWYRQQGVVSEFIRFNLYGNHRQYSGSLKPTLKNIYGKILPDQEEQWEHFVPKVRNNYRKAQQAGLTFHIAQGAEIGEGLIRTFHNLYTDTMDRNHASTMYFFSLAFFKHLVYYRPEKFAIAWVEKDGFTCSMELLILQNQNVHAFLGGTYSDYFQYRPNDFLRVELLKWASAAGFQHYVLGGGRHNDDGLYRHKKSMFPRDPDVMFYTGRKILMHDIYRELTQIHIQELEVEFEALDANYFPRYRV